KSRLGNALDKAALAAGSTPGSPEEVEAQVIKFFEANYPDDRLGTVTDIHVDLTEDTVVVTATVRVDTTFMQILGVDYIDVYEETGVVREVRGLEVVLVLDNTGSMSTNNNIATLRTATKNF